MKLEAQKINSMYIMKRSDYKTVEAYGIRDYLEECYYELDDKIKKILSEEAF